MSTAFEKYQETTSNTQGCSGCTLISLALSIAMIVMGSLFLDDCPAQRYIPIYLIVSGVFYIVASSLALLSAYLADDEGKKPKIPEGINGIISMFLLALFITGNVWIYGLYNKYSTDPADANFCNNTLYLFAFWVTTASYIMMGIGVLLCVLFCCCACACACCGKRSENVTA